MSTSRNGRIHYSRKCSSFTLLEFIALIYSLSDLILSLRIFVFFRVLIVALSTCYTLIFVAFFPLFIAFIRLIKCSFNDVYLRMRVRLYITFILFQICTGFRLSAYIVIQFSSLPWLSVETV